MQTSNLFLPVSPARECHLGFAQQTGVRKVWRGAGGRRLWLCAWHHPDVLHLVLWNLRLFHGSEEVQDKPILPHNSEWNPLKPELFLFTSVLVYWTVNDRITLQTFWIFFWFKEWLFRLIKELIKLPPWFMSDLIRGTNIPAFSGLNYWPHFYSFEACKNIFCGC